MLNGSQHHVCSSNHPILVEMVSQGQSSGAALGQTAEPDAVERYFRRKSVGEKIHCCKAWVSKVQTKVSPAPALVTGVTLDHILKSDHLQVEVESPAKISAETSPFSGGLAHCTSW